MDTKFNILGKQGFLLFISLFFILALAANSVYHKNYVSPAKAQEDGGEEEEEFNDDPITVKLVVRDADDNFIPEIRYSINVQTEDADGNPKPGSQVANGTTNVYTGIGTSTFRPDPDVNTYAIKVWDQNSKVGEFYFYDAIVSPIGGSTIEVEEKVGDLHIVLRDSQGVLRANSKFKLYTQRYDVDDDPLVDELVGSFTTGPTGDVTTYVTATDTAVDDNFSGYYVLETEGISKGKDYKYNIKAKNEETVEVAYKFSDIAFTVIDAEEVPFPAGSELRLYEQVIDLDGEKILGDFIDEIDTNDKGVAVFEYPEGTYAASLEDDHGQTYKFFDLEMQESKRTEITLQTTGDYVSGEGQCSDRSFLNVTPRSASGDIIPGLDVSLYRQEIDANGVPIATGKITSDETEATGVASMSFRPDPRDTYVLRIYDQSDDTGEFWFFDDIQFFCGQDKDISKTLSSIKVIIRDVNGNLLPDQKFSIYAQKYDVDGNPIKEKSTLVKTTKTLGEGYARIYVAPDHPYDPLKKGIYAFSVKPASEELIEYDIVVNEGEETVFEYRLPVEVDGSGDNGDNGDNGDDYTPATRTGSLLNRLKGYILLQVEDHGEAWYVDHETSLRYYMKDGPTAYEMMRRFGLGITNANLDKIAVGIDDRFEDVDTDGDGLADKMEEALGTDIYDTDSDGDGYSDGDEVRAGYSPSSSNPAKLSVDGNLTNQLLGKILLQVESRGEAWYINPSDGKRYYMKDGPAAYQIMRFLSLGISNQDLGQIPSGSL